VRRSRRSLGGGVPRAQLCVNPDVLSLGGVPRDPSPDPMTGQSSSLSTTTTDYNNMALNVVSARAIEGPPAAPSPHRPRGRLRGPVLQRELWMQEQQEQVRLLQQRR
jgi:hypothetical protein